jgi:hypothetical protein
MLVAVRLERPLRIIDEERQRTTLRRQKAKCHHESKADAWDLDEQA